MAVKWFGDISRESQVDKLSNSREEFHQTTSHDYLPCTYIKIINDADSPVQGDSGGLGLGNVDSVPSQDNLQMRRN